jgi:hypothetical protein
MDTPLCLGPLKGCQGKFLRFWVCVRGGLNKKTTTPIPPSGLWGLPPDPNFRFEISFLKCLFRPFLGSLAR